MTGSPLVLVVEDDPNVRGLLRTLLGTEGYEVVTASDGLAGLVKASSRRPALVLLDLVMPDLDGHRVLAELSADPVLSTVPVMVLTGRLEAVPALREQLGADHVVVKPFEVGALLERVTALLAGGREQSS